MNLPLNSPRYYRKLLRKQYFFSLSFLFLSLCLPLVYEEHQNINMYQHLKKYFSTRLIRSHYQLNLPIYIAQNTSTLSQKYFGIFEAELKSINFWLKSYFILFEIRRIYFSRNNMNCWKMPVIISLPSIWLVRLRIALDVIMIYHHSEQVKHGRWTIGEISVKLQGPLHMVAGILDMVLLEASWTDAHVYVKGIHSRMEEWSTSQQNILNEF